MDNVNLVPLHVSVPKYHNYLKSLHNNGSLIFVIHIIHMLFTYKITKLESIENALTGINVIKLFPKFLKNRNTSRIHTKNISSSIQEQTTVQGFLAKGERASIRLKMYSTTGFLPV